MLLLLSLQWCPTLYDLIDGSPLGSRIPGILQVRIQEWVVISFSNAWKWSYSVMSDSYRPHGLQPIRLLHPLDFPGKSTGLDCHCLLQITHYLILMLMVFTRICQCIQWNNLPRQCIWQTKRLGSNRLVSGIYCIILSEEPLWTLACFWEVQQWRGLVDSALSNAFQTLNIFKQFFTVTLR